MWQVVADLGQIMINAKKSNSVKNTLKQYVQTTNHFCRNWFMIDVIKTSNTTQLFPHLKRLESQLKKNKIK